MERLIHWPLRLALLALILLAVLMTALRLALPYADHYRDALTQALSARLHHPVSVETMTLRLTGWSPQLVLGNVTIRARQTGADLLHLRALQLDLDPVASLLAGQPRLSVLTLVGAELALHRTSDGRLSLVGLAGVGTDDPGALAILLTVGDLAITDGDVRFTDDALGGAVVRLGRLMLRLHNDGRFHRFALSASPVTASPEGAGAAPADAQLEVLANLQGEADDTRQWDGEVYLRLTGTDLAALMPQHLSGPELVRSQGGHLESWNRLEQGALRESLNRVGMSGVVFRVPAGPDPDATADTGLAISGPLVVLDQLDGLVRLTPADPGWRVQTAQLAVVVDGARRTDLELDLRLDADRRLSALDLVVTDLDLHILAPLLSAWPRSPAPYRISALDPRGRLGPLAVQVRFPPQGTPTWQVAAQVQGLALKRQGRTPGLAGLDASLRANQDSGTLTFGSNGLGLDLRPLLDAPLQFEQLGGGLTWGRIAAGGWQVASTELMLGNPDLTARGHFVIELPGDLLGDLPGPAGSPSPGPYLDLSLGLQDVDLAKVRHYLPVGALSPGVTQWLNQALVAGTLPRGELVLRGPLHRFPFRAGEGRFEVNLDFRDLVLCYLTGWPPIEAATGGLSLGAQGLEVRLDQGRLYRTDLSQGRAVISDPWDPGRLAVHLVANGPFADALTLMRDTPLAGELGPLAKALEVAGPAQFVLDLGLPVDATGAIKVDGRLSWPGPASLGLLGSPLELTGLSGELRFGLDSVQAKSIRARLWGAPVTLAIGTTKTKGARSARIRLQARSRTPVAVMAERLPSPWWRLASGTLGWDLTVDLHPGDPRGGAPSGDGRPFSFSLRSNLRGLALDLPQPLGKAATQVRPLELTGSPLPGGGFSVTGRWEPLAWDLVFGPAGTHPRLERGRVTLGAQLALPPTAPGLAIDGAVKELKLPAWFGWWEQVSSRSGTGPGTSTNLREALGTLSANLRIARLDLGRASLTRTQVQLTPVTAGWDLSIVSSQLAGQVRLPDNLTASAEPLVVRLERLDLKALMPVAGGMGGPAGPVMPARSGSRVPALDLRVADLRWGAAGLGRLDLEVRPHPTGIEVPRISYEGPGDTRVTGDADTSDAPDGAGSRVNLDLQSTDTGPLLRALDYAPLLSPAPLETRLRLGWAGGFGAFDPAQATGRIALDVGLGRLLDVNPGAGRVLGFLNGFLNLYQLRRRLALDISDVYAKGFGFERITGRIALGCGQARLETFEIAASSSDIQVSGIANLRQRTYDQLVTIVPGIGTGLALATGVAAGPAAGAGVYLFNRVTGGAINRLASYQYRITGPWERPEITRLGWAPFAGRVTGGQQVQIGPKSQP